MNSRMLAAWSGAVLATATLAACAPDAWQNYKATGYNDYLSLVQAQCQPLWIGEMQLQQFDLSSAGGQGGTFDMLLDATSRMFYNRITPGEFRTSVQSLAMTTNDPRTNRSIDCMISKLPADRPQQPPGGILR